MRYLIVNADDFGQSAGVNRGIIEAYEHGIVTSASLMVRWPGAAEAAEYGRAHPELSLGLHLDLGEWVYRDESWTPIYEVIAVDDTDAIALEVSRQQTLFRELAGKEPTHIDSHQHVHLREPARSIAHQTARRLAVPLRHCSPEIRHCGKFYGQTTEGSPHTEGISVEGLLAILAALPPGLTELGCHPGRGADLNTMYASERAQEVRTLCDPRVRAAVLERDIELCNFGNFSALLTQPAVASDRIGLESAPGHAPWV